MKKNGKKKNPQDATLRNVRAAKRRSTNLEFAMERLAIYAAADRMRLNILEREVHDLKAVMSLFERKGGPSYKAARRKK